MKGWRWLCLSLMVGLAGPASAVDSPQVPVLKCDIGPVTRQYGNTPWRVYSCADNQSLVVVAAPGNPAMPFYFFLTHTSNGYRIRGEGEGDKSLTDAVAAELAQLSDEDMAALLAETQKSTLRP